MPADVGKCDQTCVPLKGVKPVPYPGIRRNVRFSLQPDINAVNTVKQNRQKNRPPLDKGTKWDRLQLARHFVVSLRAYQSRAVRPKMLSEKRSNGKDAGK